MPYDPENSFQSARTGPPANRTPGRPKLPRRADPPRRIGRPHAFVERMTHPRPAYWAKPLSNVTSSRPTARANAARNASFHTLADSKASASHKLTSGRNIVVVQKFRHALRIELEMTGSLGPHHRRSNSPPGIGRLWHRRRGTRPSQACLLATRVPVREPQHRYEFALGLPCRDSL